MTGDKAGGDGGADILATDPRNGDFAIQCKRYAPAKAVVIGDGSELNGALAHEHPSSCSPGPPAPAIRHPLSRRPHPGNHAGETT